MAVSPQQGEFSQRVVRDHGLEFPLLIDPENHFAGLIGIVFRLPDDLKEQYRSFGLDIAAYNGDDSWTLPVPAHYVVDQQGQIVFRELQPDHTVRSDPNHTLAAIRSIR